MLTVCPQCNKRHEVAKSDKSTRVICSCGNIFKVPPWPSYRQIISLKTGGKCPYCQRKYKIKSFTDQTEIACSCGNLLFVANKVPVEAVSGRRKADRAIRLLEKELLGIIDTSHLLHSSIQNLDNLMRMTMRITTNMLEVEECSVVVRNKEKENLILYTLTGKKSTELSSFEIPENEGFFGKGTLNKTTIIKNDVGSQAAAAGNKKKAGNFNTRSILCVPLMVDSSCVGELELVNKKNKEGFGDHDVLLAEAVASQIAVAIQNVQLTKKALKAERRAAMGEAVSGVAHYVKNMLNGLHGGLYVVKSDIRRAGVDVDGTGFELLERNLERLTDLVKDMLTTAADRKPRLEFTDINDLAGSVINLMGPNAKKQEITLEFTPDKKLKKVFIDPKGIYRCILNIIGNALEASKEYPGTVIKVIVSGKSKREFTITVSDQGSGMDKTTISSIFKPFYTNKGAEGTGLGLSVTQKVISEHEGTIQVISKPGKGSTFTLHLPVNLKPS
jgi:signal transduction histidine kinase